MSVENDQFLVQRLYGPKAFYRRPTRTEILVAIRGGQKCLFPGSLHERHSPPTVLPPFRGAPSAISRCSLRHFSSDQPALLSADTQPQSLPSNPTQQVDAQCPPEFARILVGVCTLNESENIESLIHQIRQAVPEADVLIVDDQSEDGTSAIVNTLAESDKKIQLNVRGQRGLGGAIRHAMIAAIKGEYDLFINMDGDLSHSPSDLPAMLKTHLESDDLDVVIGSRYVSGGLIKGWPVHRRWMSWLVNRFATLCLGLPVKDCSGSMRSYRVSALRDASAADLQSNGYSVLEEILVAMHRGGATMAEVPITFTDRTQGQSKLTIREAIRSMVHMVKLAIR